jgi:D-alanyl-D-alanine carboxypeptidase
MIEILLAAAATQPPADPAQGYRPVACEARRPYAGRPMHAPISSELAAPFVERALPPETAILLSAAFAEAQRKTGAEALSVAVAQLGEGLWSRDAIPGPAERLWWGSTAKTFVAIIVLQLAGEGRLSLDDPIARWVAGVPNGNVATIRDLLQHTGGLFSANEDPAWRAAPRPLTPELTLEIVGRRGAMFCPGEHWRYSNSGYTFLGEVIETVEGRPWQDSVEARIVEPLGLDSVKVMRPNVPAGIAPPRSSQPQVGDPTWTGPAGGIAGAADDMVRFWAAFLGGRLVPPETRDMMFAKLFPMFDNTSFYGLGTMVFDLPNGSDRLILLGHAGGGPGANALIAYSPRDRAIVAVALNADAPSPAVVNLMLRTLRALPVVAL